MDQSEYQTGDKARVKSTGISVTISRISDHGFAVVRFECGYERMLLVSQLQPYMHKTNATQATAAA